MNILSQPVRSKCIQFNSHQHKNSVWERLKRNTKNNSIDSPRLFIPDFHTVYRGEITEQHFKITRRNSNAKSLPTIQGSVTLNGSLKITLEKSLFSKAILIFAILIYGSLLFKMLKNPILTLEFFTIQIAIASLPLLAFLFVYRWSQNLSTNDEWEMLERVFNEG